MIGMMNGRSQDIDATDQWARRFPVLARLKGLANGVNPRWGTKTVVVSNRTGNIVRLEDRAKMGTAK